MKSSEVPLLLFAKAPIAGQVKTRLTSDCSPMQAAAIAEILIEESLKAVTQFWPGKVYLSVWQQNKHPFIVKMMQRYQVELLLQTDGDLGEKMLSAFTAVGYPAAIMGCDAPLIMPQVLRQAHHFLLQGKNMIGPSEDGGYYFIGLSQAVAGLFERVSWGSELVLEETMESAARLSIELMQLPSSYDIDRWDDVMRASRQLPMLATYLNSQGLLI